MTPSDQTLLADCAAFTSQWEGCIPHLYLDGPGNVTGLMGHLFRTAVEAATAFGVTVEEMQPDWDAVMGSKPGMGPGYYAALTKCRATEAQINAVAAADLAEHVAHCARWIDGWDTLPRPAQVAAVDIDFNVKGGVTSFPHFVAAVEDRDWTAAATACHRKEGPGGVQTARNEATAALFSGLG